MPSIMMVAELHFLFAILLSPLSSSFGYGQSLVDMATIVPAISIGTCSPLINGRSFAICCKASFLDGALVRLYGPNGIFLPYNLSVNYVSNKSLSLKCANETIKDFSVSCWRTEIESLYLVNLSSFDQTLHLGDWSCEAYIGSAKMTVSSREVITRNDGLVETQVNQTVQLLWNVTKDYVVISPSNKVLVNVSGDVLYSKSDHVEFIRNNATGKTGIKLKNTSGSDAGMYIFQASNGVRAALSLQVQEKPTTPKVIYRNLHIEGYPKEASAILYCLSESQSKGPMMYEQGVEYKWNGLTSETGLQVGLYGSGVIVWNVDCTKIISYPISCNAQQYGLKSETTWIIPQNLCLDNLHSMLKYPPQMLTVRKSQIVKDVLNLFEDSSTGTHQISTKFDGEAGADGGVSREMITVFWNEVKEMYFHGNEVFVPHLCPERLSQKKDFVTLGRIFSLSTATLRSIPFQICRSTLMVIIHDTCDVDPDILLDDFLLFLDNEDRELVKSSLNSFDNMRDEEKGKLQEFLMKFGMGIVPRAATLSEHMINLAQNELCFKPKFLCEDMRKGIPLNHMDHFWMQMTLDHLDCLYEDFLITAKHILTKIRCERWPLQNPNEKRVYYYLRDLIQDLDEKTLLSFVQFVTAGRKIPSSFITVGFNDTQGIARCPIASTCAYRLDIPRSYDNFEDFKNEFVNVLKSDEAKLFSEN